MSWGEWEDKAEEDKDNVSGRLTGRAWVTEWLCVIRYRRQSLGVRLCGD